MEANVATTADSYSLKRGPAKPPISTHPAFPAIVALWFAALLGLGSLVLPIALLERVVTVTGIAALIPSAAPPLGFTAHAGIALAGAIAGAALGLALARKIASAHAEEPAGRQFRTGDDEPRRPISAHDELGDESLAPALGNAPPLLAQKRRSLAMAEDNGRSTYLEAVPLPGHSPDRPADHTADVEPAPAAEGDLSEPLELGEFSDLDESDNDQPAAVEADPALEALRSRIHDPVESTSFQEPQMTDTYSFDEAADSDHHEGERQEFMPIEAVNPAADAHDPLPFAPPSLRRLEPTAFDEDEDLDMADEAIEDATPQLSVVEFAEPDFDEDGGPDRPLDELGLVQLAARLGASLKKRRARLATQAPTVAAPALAAIAPSEDFEAAEAEDAARAIADFFSAGAPEEPVIEAVDEEPEAETAAIPAPLRSLAVHTDDEDGDDDAFAASFSLPLGVTQDSVSPADEDDETDEDDGEYSSLLGMKNPFARQQEFVRVEEPESNGDTFEPTVTFPHPPPAQTAGLPEAPDSSFSRPFDPPRTPANPAPAASPRDAGDAERSLREALATLQRMSGAA
jgi:hypothetical protein